jgi:hypothetical protein
MRVIPVSLLFRMRASRARRYYRNRGYSLAQLPCSSCVWEHDVKNNETPWQWIYCHECDWGNR